MLFDKPIFFVFLTLVTVLYWRLRWRSQNVLLLVASYFFYGWWDWRFLSLLWISTVVDFYLARWISQAQSPAKRRLCLITSLVMNFGFLGFFKYFNFFIDSFEHVARFVGLGDSAMPVLRILLPPGISFYTFQAVAYIVDVYNERQKPAASLVDYSLFISLFPHLIAGPIQRPSHLLPQVQAPREYDAVKFFDGLMLIVTGLFRKCVIADNCALLVNGVFSGGFGELNAPLVLLGIYAFAWQIYGDFSGYSDIARGSAQLLGFHFMVNFRQPYLATSLRDFWRRWHISLSTWLRDYLYIALGGNRGSEARTSVNLFTTMLLGGLWHGANWVFVIWGAIHGFGLMVGRWLTGSSSTAKEVEAIPSGRSSSVTIWLKRVALFHFVCFGWLFFRASSVHEAFHWLGGLAHFGWKAQYIPAALYLLLFTVPLFWLDLRMERYEEEYPFQKLALTNAKASYQWRVAVAGGALLIIALLAGSNPNAFIYFQF